MTLDEFRRLAETWGGDIARWPEPERREAEALARDPAAAAILAEASRLDRLATRAAPEVSERRAGDAMAAVTMRLAAERQATATPQRLFALPRWLAPATALACAAVLGVFIGLVYPAISPNVAEGLMFGALLDDSIPFITVLQ